MSLSIEQALDKIYEALKGAATDGQGSIEYSLTKIAETLETGSNVNLPAVTSDDNGDVLTVVEGNWSKADIPSQLPTVTATDNGDVLTVVEGAWAKADIPSQLPAVTGSDNGNVLTVVEGSWAKAAPSGGGDFVKITAEYVDEQLTLDKTYAEIAEIIEGGGIPFVYSGTSVYMLTGYDTSSGFAKFGASIYYGTGTTAYVDEIYVNGDGATSTFMSLTVLASGE